MHIHKIDLASTDSFSKEFLKYLDPESSFTPFYNYYPSIENIAKAIENRRFPQETRIVLQQVLIDQYKGLTKHWSVDQNLHRISDPNTFTVTTGHQLNIFTGPLYVIFKLVTTINLSKRLREAYPGFHFVPVYWMASEDHDFEEINHFHLFGKKYTWETLQKGPVGRFTTQSLNVLLQQLPESLPLFEQAYLDSSTLSEAVRFYINTLFGEEGLIVLDADNRKLKSLFSPVMKEEILNQPHFSKVASTNAKLEKLGMDPLAFARPINLFYLNGQRDRIEKENDSYQIIGTEKQFSQDEMLRILEETPERISPNVILRPLYQETILPNLAYVGGPSELLYWLQLKEVFEHNHTPFPILFPRNFGMIISKSIARKCEKLSLSLQDIFKETRELKQKYLSAHVAYTFDVENEKATIKTVFDSIKAKSLVIDKTLEGYISGEYIKTEKALESIEKRLRKILETQNEQALAQIDQIKEKLFPEGGLQERHENFLNFYINNPIFIKSLLEHFDPFDFQFYQMVEE